MKPFCLAAFLVAVSACSSVDVDRTTQITVALSTETEVPKELDVFTVRVISTRTGELRFSRDYYPTSGRDFPTTLAVVPLDDDSVASPVRIQVEARKGGHVFLRRQSVVSYFKGRNLLLTMPLRMACFEFRDCGDNGTCAGGECIDATVDAAALRDFDASFISPSYAGCFDEQRCLSRATATEVDADCTFPVPAGTGNVAIRWAAAPDRILTLEADDPQEGWTRISADRGRLSQGSCNSHFRRADAQGPLVADWAETIYVDASCPSKTMTQPSCFSTATNHAGVGAVVP